MGFNIEINYDARYISYNWSAYSDIFYIRDVDGKTGSYASEKIKEALCTLIKMGHMPLINLPKDYFIDEWGTPKDGTKSNDWHDERYLHVRMRMFGWILTNLLECFENNEDSYIHLD